MVGELTPVRIDVASTDRAFWNRFHELRRVRQNESRPDDPVQPDEEVETRMKKGNPFEFQHFYEISRDGVMLSSFYGETVTPRNAEYETNKHLFWADGYVRPDARRQGIGALWVPVIAKLMDEHGCTVVGMSTEEEPGHGFLEWLGGEQKPTEIEIPSQTSEGALPYPESSVAQVVHRSPPPREFYYEGVLPESVLADFAPQLTHCSTRCLS